MRNDGKVAARCRGQRARDPADDDAARADRAVEVDAGLACVVVAHDVLDADQLVLADLRSLGAAAAEIDLQPLRGRGVVHRVDTVRTVVDVLAGAASGVDEVIAGTADHRVGSRPTRQMVVVVAAVQAVVTRSTRQVVPARSTRQVVVAVLAPKAIVAGIALQRIVASATVMRFSTTRSGPGVAGVVSEVAVHDRLPGRVVDMGFGHPDVGAVAVGVGEGVDLGVAVLDFGLDDLIPHDRPGLVRVDRLGTAGPVLDLEDRCHGAVHDGELIALVARRSTA